MSDNRSWRKSYQPYTEDAIGLVRECVAVMRARGLKSDTALHDLPAIMQTSQRRVRTLFHRDGMPVVLKNEWMSLRYRVGLFFLNEAERLRELADKHEARGNDLVSGQTEFQWEQPTNATRRHCA